MTDLGRDEWFATLGTDVPDRQKNAARDYLVSEGYDPWETSTILTFVCREIRHDEPERAFKYLRSFVGSAEVVVLRTLAALCCDSRSPTEQIAVQHELENA